MKIKDELVMTNQSNSIYKIEAEACRLYRDKYPDGVPWHDLHIDTRKNWFNQAEEKINNCTKK